MYGLKQVNDMVKIQGFNGIYYFEFGREFSHSPEKHDFWEMVYVDMGRVNAITNGVGCTLEQGQVIFHQPDEVHSHVSDKEVANNMLVVCFTAKGQFMDFLKNKTFTLDKTGKMLLSLFLEEAKKALGDIPSDYGNVEDISFLEESSVSTQLMQCHLTELILRLVRDGDEQQVKVTKKSRDIANNSLTELMCRYLEENVYGNVSVTDLCANFLLGKTQLYKIFGDSMGISPIEYYTELKISQAKKMLREKNHSVSQIAYMLGYSGIHNFSRAFKKAVGCSPTAYSKSIR